MFHVHCKLSTANYPLQAVLAHLYASNHGLCFETHCLTHWNSAPFLHTHTRHHTTRHECACPFLPLPQCYAEKQAQGLVPEELLDTGVNPAVFEIAGHMVLKRREDYEGITQDLAWRLLAEVSLSEERFQEVSQLCFGVGPAR